LPSIDHPLAIARCTQPCPLRCVAALDGKHRPPPLLLESGTPQRLCHTHGSARRRLQTLQGRRVARRDPWGVPGSRRARPAAWLAECQCRGI